MNYSVNLATTAPINIDGALTGSEIYISHVSLSTDEHDTGVLTSGFTAKNSGAKLGDFFTYDGPDAYKMVLNAGGELEVKEKTASERLAGAFAGEGSYATETTVKSGSTDLFKVKDLNGVRTITLLNGIAATENDSAFIIPAGVNIVLDLNGKTLDRGLSGKTAAANGNVIVNYGKLTVKDGSGDKTGTITGGNATWGGASTSRVSPVPRP